MGILSHLGKYLLPPFGLLATLCELLVSRLDLGSTHFKEMSHSLALQAVPLVIFYPCGTELERKDS